MCEKFGKVHKVQLIEEPQTGISRGFGFAYFEDKDSCLRFIEATNDQEIDGKRVCCQVAM